MPARYPCLDLITRDACGVSNLLNCEGFVHYANLWRLVGASCMQAPTVCQRFAGWQVKFSSLSIRRPLRGLFPLPGEHFLGSLLVLSIVFQGKSRWIWALATGAWNRNAEVVSKISNASFRGQTLAAAPPTMTLLQISFGPVLLSYHQLGFVFAIEGIFAKASHHAASLGALVRQSWCAKRKSR